MDQAIPGQVQIIGLNESGFGSNSLMTAVADLPWLQDTDTNQNGQSDIWYDQWDIEFRDVLIVDGTGTQIGVYNLTQNNLVDSANYALLRDTLLALGEGRAPWQNATNQYDVNDDGSITAVGDVLPLINEVNVPTLINENSFLPLPAAVDRYLDVNGDQRLTPVSDILPLINLLNSSGSGEGEASEFEFQHNEELADSLPEPLPQQTDLDGGEEEANHKTDPTEAMLQVPVWQTGHAPEEHDTSPGSSTVGATENSFDEIFADPALDFLLDAEEDSSSD